MSAMLFVLLVAMTTLVFIQGQECPEGWSLYPEGKTCIKVSDRKNKMSWADAREECAKDGADLVKIGDVGMRNFIKGQISGRNYYWIGLHDEDSDGTFQWVDGQDVGPLEWWDCREPNNHGNKERCVEIIAFKNGRWNDKQCTKKRSFICQKEIVVEELDVIEQWSCDFEKGDFCTYINQTDPKTKLFVQRAGDAIVGPNVDHLWSENGHYALASGNSGYSLFNFQLTNITMTDKHRCWTFWYRLNNAIDIKLFRLETHLHSFTQTQTPIVIEREAEMVWIKAYIDLYSDPPKLLNSLIVHLTSDTGSLHCAIDDMKFTQGTCARLREFDGRNLLTET